MPDTEPLKTSQFMVEIDGLAHLAFSEVVLPEESIEVIVYLEGNEAADRVHKIPGRRHVGDLTLRRAVSSSNKDLSDWFRLTFDANVQRRNGTVTLLDHSRKPAVIWKFENALPIRYQVSPLDTAGNEVVIETLVLAVESFERT